MTQPPEPPSQPPSSPPPPPTSPYGAAPYASSPPPRRRTWLWIALGALGVLVVLGVVGALVASNDDTTGHVTAASAGPTDASGATTVQGNGLSVSVPAGWKAVPLDSNDLKSFLDRATNDNPQLARSLNDQVQNLVTKDVQFFAFKTASLTSGFGTNVSILTVNAPVGDLDQMGTAAKVQLSGIGATDISTQQVSYPQGDAVKATYSYTMNANGGSIQVSGEQVYLPIEGQVAIVTLTSRDRAADEPAFETMVRTLQLT